MMKHMNARLAWSIGMLLAAAAVAGCARETSETVDEKKSAVADLALRNGAIYTVNGARSWAADDRDRRRAHRLRRQRRGREGLHRPADEGRRPQGPHGPAGHAGRARASDLGRHRGDRLRPQRRDDGRRIPRHDQEVRRCAPERAVDHGRRLGHVRLRSRRAGAQGADRRHRARPAGDPLEPRRPHDLGQQQGARGRGHHEGHEGPAGRPHRPRPENRRAERQPPGRRQRPRRRTSRPPTPTRRATRACATRSRC